MSDRREPVWEMPFTAHCHGPFYAAEEVSTVVFLQQVWGLQVGLRIPCVVAFWVPLPLDQVLQLFLPPMTLVAPDSLNLVVFFAFY
jgi:hypothetical protein